MSTQQIADGLLYGTRAVPRHDTHRDGPARLLAEQERIRAPHGLRNAQPMQVQHRVVWCAEVGNRRSFAPMVLTLREPDALRRCMTQ